MSIIFLKEFIELNVKTDIIIKKCETYGIKYKYKCILEYTNFKDELTEYKCLRCNKSYQQKFDEKVKERFLNAYKYSNTLFYYENSKQKGASKNCT